MRYGKWAGDPQGRTEDPTKCPKCGHNSIRAYYQEGRECLAVWDTDRTLAAHLRRRCERCGYAWNEACVKGGDDE